MPAASTPAVRNPSRSKCVVTALLWQSPVITFPFLGCLLLAVCGLFSGDCTSEAHPGLIIRVLDNSTNETPTVRSSVTITNGVWTQTDSL